ncbi:MAG: hypothetical protein N2652_10485 [Kiritimatiellae bacterium]|nr:hypothetical protein [Kiritimatiellia bacterium]
MNRKLALALALMGIAVLVMLLNARDTVTLNLAVTSYSMRAAFAYLGFAAVGVLVGALLK